MDLAEVVSAEVVSVEGLAMHNMKYNSTPKVLSLRALDCACCAIKACI